jgi:hypothetical protein
MNSMRYIAKTRWDFQKRTLFSEKERNSVRDRDEFDDCPERGVLSL